MSDTTAATAVGEPEGATGREPAAGPTGSDRATGLLRSIVESSSLVVFLAVVASLLIGVSISLGGPIGFVGLIVPHALRALLGPDHRLLLPASALGGGVLVVLCDLVARLAIAPAQLPTGAVTALFGGPFFVLILVWHKRRAGRWEAP